MPLVSPAFRHLSRLQADAPEPSTGCGSGGAAYSRDGDRYLASDEDRYRILSELRAATRGGDVDVSVERRAGDFERFGDLGCGFATGQSRAGRGEFVGV
jgi:hypothetical protein